MTHKYKNTINYIKKNHNLNLNETLIMIRFFVYDDINIK